MSEPLILPRNCDNCRHFDAEHWCALKEKDALIDGYIIDPVRVVCEKHEPKDADDE